MNALNVERVPAVAVLQFTKIQDWNRSTKIDNEVELADDMLQQNS